VGCGRCGALLEDGDLFCGDCGAPVGGCPSCGKPLTPGKRFCRYCGATLFEAAPAPAAVTLAVPEAATERRMCSVLFCDMVGFTPLRLAAENPVILLVEDAQHADAGLLDFVDHLIDWTRDLPVYVLVFARPELGQARIRRGPQPQHADRPAGRATRHRHRMGHEPAGRRRGIR
jgi:Double zinc ribbon